MAWYEAYGIWYGYGMVGTRRWDPGPTWDPGPRLVPNHTIPSHTMPRNAIPSHTMPSHAMQCHSTSHIMLCHAILDHFILYYTIHYDSYLEQMTYFELCGPFGHIKYDVSHIPKLILTLPEFQNKSQLLVVLCF